MYIPQTQPAINTSCYAQVETFDLYPARSYRCVTEQEYGQMSSAKQELPSVGLILIIGGMIFVIALAILAAIYATKTPKWR